MNVTEAWAMFSERISIFDVPGPRVIFAAGYAAGQVAAETELRELRMSQAIERRTIEALRETIREGQSHHFAAGSL